MSFGNPELIKAINDLALYCLVAAGLLGAIDLATGLYNQMRANSRVK